MACVDVGGRGVRAGRQYVPRKQTSEDGPALLRGVARYSFWERIGEQIPKFAYVRLIIYGRKLVRRTQANRVLRGLDHKELIVLDFDQVEEVGEQFVYRIFLVQHWAKRFEAINAEAHRAGFLRAHLRWKKNC